MGKAKNEPRTKGNTKPSSSGRTAVLMGGTTGFIGFEALNDASFVPASSQFDDDNQVSSEFRVCLRKMSKKDPITKVKALQEFIKLCTTEDKDSVKSMIPFWPRLFTKLCLDHDWKVREKTQTAHSAVVSQLGKDLAPHLRSMMPAWLLGMNDPMRNIAELAKTTFEQTFSETKRAGVMEYCSKEILENISDSLLIQTPETVQDKFQNTEESNERYIRLIYSSLKALSVFLKTVQGKDSSKVVLPYEKIHYLLDQEKFWKFSKYGNSLIRCAWYELMYSLMDRYPQLMENASLTLTKYMFSSITESEPCAVPMCWKTFLCFIMNFKSCWEVTKNTEIFTKNVCKAVAGGGYTMPSDVYPRIVSILEIVPSSVATDDFYISFFNGFSSSVTLKTICINRSGGPAILEALFDSLRLITPIKMNSEALWESVTENQLIGIIRACWSDHPNVRKSVYFKLLAKSLVYWDEASPKIADKFWNKFVLLTDQAITSTEQTQMQIIVNVYSIIQFELKSANAHNLLSRIAIRIAPIIKKSYDMFQQEKDTFNIFAHLLACYPSKEAYGLLLGVEPSTDLARPLLNQTLLPIFNSGLSFSNDGFVEIFMSVYVQCHETTRLSLLQSLMAPVSWAALTCLVKRLSKLQDPVGLTWLRSAPFGCKLVKAAEQFCAHVTMPQSAQSDAMLIEKTHLHTLLELAFTNAKQKEPLFPFEYIGQVIQVFLTTMPALEDMDTSKISPELLDTASKLGSEILKSSFCWEIPSVVDLLCRLYQILCFSDPDTSAYQQLYNLLKTSFKVYLKNPTCVEQMFNENQFICRLVQETNGVLKSDHTHFTMTVEIADLWCHFVTESRISLTIFRGIVDIFVPSPSDVALLENQLSSFYVVNKMFINGFHFAKLPTHVSIDESVDLLFAKRCLFLSKMLLQVLDWPHTNSFSTDTTFTSLIALLVHGECYAHEIFKLKSPVHYKYLKDDLRYGCESMKNGLNNLMKKLDTKSIRQVLSTISNRCSSSPGWRVTLYNFLDRWLTTDQINENYINSDVIYQVELAFVSEDQLELSLQSMCIDIENQTPLTASALISDMAVILNRLSADKTGTAVEKVMSMFIKWQESHKEIYNEIVPDWTKASFHVSSLCLFTQTIQHHAKRLRQQHWDLILCSLTQWSQQMTNFSNDIDKNPVIALLVGVASHFCAALSEVIPHQDEKHSEHPSSLAEEWEKVYAPPLYTLFFNFFIECAASPQRSPDVVVDSVCSSLSCFLASMSLEHLLAADVRSRLAADKEETRISPQLQSIVNQLIPMLQSHHWNTQSLTYLLLNRVLPEVVKSWKQSENPEEEPTIEDLPTFITNVVTENELQVENLERDDYVDNVFADDKIQSVSDGYFLAFTVLLNWCVLESEANVEICASYLRETGQLNKLLNYLFRVTPFPILMESKLPASQFKFIGEDYEISPMNKKIEANCRHEILGSRLYKQLLSVLPASVRSWWSSLDRNLQKSVDHFTTIHVSPSLIDYELDIINNSEVQFDSMEIKCRRGAREVVATYSVDEARMETVLKMAPNHPLTTVAFEYHRRILVSQQEWNTWMRTMMNMLMRRNSSLLDSLIVFNKNLDQKLGGIEECCICYYVIHIRTHQIPKSLCKTCKKKFHYFCLYKWITQSNATATCPMCRSPI